jgi:hypothetical protein
MLVRRIEDVLQFPHALNVFGQLGLNILFAFESIRESRIVLVQTDLLFWRDKKFAVIHGASNLVQTNMTLLFSAPARLRGEIAIFVLK